MTNEILVVDDNLDIRVLISSILKDKGFAVREAANFDQALIEIKKKISDVAIIDVKLDKGDRDGIELLTIVKKLDNTNNNDYGLEKPKDDLSITAKIINVNKRGSYKIYITLDNKQTWRSVKDIYDRIPVNEGQTVSISKGFISGYVMKVEGKKVSLRVRRVK